MGQSILAFGILMAILFSPSTGEKEAPGEDPIGKLKIVLGEMKSVENLLTAASLKRKSPEPKDITEHLGSEVMPRMKKIIDTLDEVLRNLNHLPLQRSPRPVKAKSKSSETDRTRRISTPDYDRLKKTGDRGEKRKAEASKKKAGDRNRNKTEVSVPDTGKRKRSTWMPVLPKTNFGAVPVPAGGKIPPKYENLIRIYFEKLSKAASRKKAGTQVPGG
jgi:hypothetical protein